MSYLEHMDTYEMASRKCKDYGHVGEWEYTGIDWLQKQPQGWPKKTSQQIQYTGGTVNAIMHFRRCCRFCGIVEYRDLMRDLPKEEAFY
jgi:hypothetical protein